MPSSETVRGFERGTSLSLAEDPMLQLTRVFVYFLQNLFREAPEGWGMRWRPDEENTELLITDQKPRLDAVEKKPHITCVLGESQWAVLGIDQLQKMKMMSNGERTHSDLISATISYHCQAREGMHARRLAWNASYFTNVYRRVIIKGGGLHQVGMKHSITPESGPSVYTGPLSEEKIISVVVTIPFYWQPQWLIRDPSVTFRQVSMNLGVPPPAKRFSAGEAANIKKASMYGRPVVPVPTQSEDETVLNQTVKDDKFEGEE
jgi:hypothetical protein